MRTRTGKIARLPRTVRDRLNQRLANGESGEALLEWLHAQPEVLEVLVRDFDGRPILKQNLSDWRRGGFRDWEARQERIETVQRLAEEADDIESAAAELPDRLSAIVAERFASLISATASVKDWSKPRLRAQLMELCEGIATLRRFDQGAARLKQEREQLDLKKAELALAQEAQTKRTHEQWREWTDAYTSHLLKTSKSPEEALRGILILLNGHANEELIRQQHEKNREKDGLPPIPDDATLLERTAGLMQTHAIAEEMRNGTAQESQGQSNPVKP